MMGWASILFQISGEPRRADREASTLSPTMSPGCPEVIFCEPAKDILTVLVAPRGERYPRLFRGYVCGIAH